MTVGSHWEQRCAELLERIAAADVAGIDPKPLREELKRLMAARPPEKNDGTSAKG